MRTVGVLSALTLISVWLGCIAWYTTTVGTEWEQTMRGVECARARFDAAMEGRPEPDCHEPHPGWPARHPVLSAIIASLAVLVGGRLWLLLRRLEDAATGRRL